MPAKSSTNKKLRQRALQVLHCLKMRYPTLETHLDASTPWQQIVATVLSAQCTDARVNMVTPSLFTKWPGPKELALAQQEDVEKVIYSTGFYRNKASNLIAAAKRIMTVYEGDIPKTLEELVTLPGVARKTANVVLYTCFGINQGIAVDTHVKRIAYRLGLTKEQDPIRVEQDLMALFPQEEWGGVNHRMVWFGRQVCPARSPHCQECELVDICPKLAVPAA